MKGSDELAVKFYSECIEGWEICNVSYNFMNKLPDRCKEMLFFYYSICGDIEKIYKILHRLEGEKDIKSPIEQMFFIAFIVLDEECFSNENSFCMVIYSQKEIMTLNKKYRSDFLIKCMEGNNPFNDTLYKLIVECDGHDFHKATKEQVEHDNERDFELKTSGYDILHFSGTQIYKNPWKCASDTIDYLKKVVETKTHLSKGDNDVG